LHDDQGASTFATEVVFNILAACTGFIVFGSFPFGVFERTGREDAAGGESTAFVLAIGAMTDGLSDRFGVNFESDGTAHTRTLKSHDFRPSVKSRKAWNDFD
jgi:hypothetical protein